MSEGALDWSFMPVSERNFFKDEAGIIGNMKRRLTALLLVPRLRSVAGTGSKLRVYRRMATPTSICWTTRRFKGSTSTMAGNVGSGTLCISR